MVSGAALQPAVRAKALIMSFREELMAATDVSQLARARVGMHMNRATDADLPAGFLEVLLPLHQRFTPWQQQLIERRRRVLEAAHEGRRPEHLPPSQAA